MNLRMSATSRVVNALNAVAQRSLAASYCVAFVFILLVAGGCEQGVQRVAVSGQVLLDGEPLKLGTIRFVSTEGRPASSQIASDGSFRITSKSLSAGGAEIAGLLPGSYQIAVLATEALGDAEDDEVRWLVPRHYGDFRASGLQADIQAPNESMIVELTWEGYEETTSETDIEGASLIQKDRETREERKE